MKKHIPNFITSLNLAAGFFAIIFIMNGNLVAGSWLILAAMIFDFLDGFSARILKSYSLIGKELDSLADVVSFGIAPALIIFRLLSGSLSFSEPLFSGPAGFRQVMALVFPVIMPVCAALRLAVFNTDESQSASFKGLPTPANALAVISIVIAQQYSDAQIITSFSGSAVALIIFTLALSLLMVSRLPLLSLKVSHLKLRGNEGRFIMVGLIITALIIFGLAAVLLIIPFYIIASLFTLVISKENT